MGGNYGRDDGDVEGAPPAVGERIGDQVVRKARSMRLPSLRGVIDRRILVNYRVDPDVLARLLPSPFRPQMIGGFALAWICLIRLRGVRPRWAGWLPGLRSENAAHRIAV